MVLKFFYINNQLAQQVNLILSYEGGQGLSDFGTASLSCRRKRGAVNLTEGTTPLCDCETMNNWYLFICISPP